MDFDVESIIEQLEDGDAKKYFNAPPPPRSRLEALEQRLEKFQDTLDEADLNENATKARRLGRIVKNYQNAIRSCKAGKEFDYDSLPCPPGFAPIPISSPARVAPTQSSTLPARRPPAPKPPVAAGATAAQPQSSVAEQPKSVIEQPKPKAASPSKTVVPGVPGSSKTLPTPPKAPPRQNLKRASSIADKQLTYLTERQRLFKEAALESKRKGDIQQAKEYLRSAKGFGPLIEATKSGLPIDATSIPTPPQIKDDFVVVTHEDTADDENVDEREESYRKIEIELQKQIEMCKRNKEHFLKLGDVSTASKFEKYAVDSCKDLDMLRSHWKNGERMPSYRHETRSFSIVVCNTNIAINELIVEVLQAINIPLKVAVDTYVKVEFPFPNDNIQIAKTRTTRDSLNPEYNEVLKFNIDRKSRQLPRVFKRHPLKLELYSKGGLFRSDTFIGTALVKLSDLENKCSIHDSFPLVEGRKAVGGKIIVKVQIREPLLSKQVEEVNEKWLVF